MPSVWGCLLLCASSVCVTFAQEAAAPAGSVLGHVTYADTQQPARLAHVVLQPMVDPHLPMPNQTEEHYGYRNYKAESVFHLQTVGLDGSFAIASVPPGLYYVIAEQDGYISPLFLFTRQQLNRPDEATLRKIAHYMTSITVTAGQTTQA